MDLVETYGFKLGLSIISIALCYILGRFAGLKTKQFLNMLFNKRIFKKYFGQSYENIDTVISLLIKYSFYIVGIGLVLQILEIPFSQNLIYTMISYVPNLLLAFLFVLLGFMLGDLAKKTIALSLSNMGIDELFMELDKRLLPSHLTGIFIQYTIIIVSIIIGLSQLGLQTQILSWITFSLITLLTFFIFLFFYSASKPFLPEIFAGMVLRNSKHIKIGEYLFYEKEKVRLIGIGILTAKLETKSKQIIVKNSVLLDKVIKPK